MASRALPEEEVAVIANCLCCDTYFMFVLDSVAPRAALLPPSDQASWEALLGTIAGRTAQQGADTGWQLPCPACMALVHGVASAQAAHDADLEAILTPCRIVCFQDRGSDDDEPPVYMPSPTTGVEAGKLRLWELVEGVGPPELTAEAAGGALRRADLKPYGVRSLALPPSALPPREDARERLRALDAAASRAQTHRAASLHAAWLRLRPLFERSWADVEAELSRCCEPINDTAI